MEDGRGAGAPGRCRARGAPSRSPRRKRRSRPRPECSRRASGQVSGDGEHGKRAARPGDPGHGQAVRRAARSTRGLLASTASRCPGPSARRRSPPRSCRGPAAPPPWPGTAWHRASVEARVLSWARRPARICASATAADASALVSFPLRRALDRISSVSVTSRSRCRSSMRSSRRRWSSSALRSRAASPRSAGPGRGDRPRASSRRRAARSTAADVLPTWPGPPGAAPRSARPSGPPGLPPGAGRPARA